MIGYIYKLTSVHTDKCYVGSTIQSIEKRFYDHSHHYAYWKNGTQHYTSSFVLFELGIDAVQIEIIEEIVFENIIQLKDKERFYININNCVNKIIPNRTRNERYVDNPKKDLLNNKKYYEKNKKNICLSRSEKILCQCGNEITKGCKTRHLQSQKHLNYQSGIAVSLS